MTLENWLVIQSRENCEYAFAVLEISETRIPDEALLSFLAHELIVAHANPAMMKHECDSLLRDARELNLDVIEQYVREEALEGDWMEVEQNLLNAYLTRDIFPDPGKSGWALATRIGNWGETLVAKFLSVFEGFGLPIYKLRLREKKDWAAKLTDLCLIKQENLDKPLVCYTEVKTHSSKCDEDLGIKGHGSLTRGDALDDPEIVRFIKAWLYETGELEKAKFFSDLRAGRTECDKRHDLYIVHETNTWQEDILTNLDEHGLDKRLVEFSVRVFLIDDLRQLIDETYGHAWRAVKEILDG